MIGEIFYDDKNYSKRAMWCNENNCHIEEIERDDKGRRFQIVENPKPTPAEINESKICELKRKLQETDYQAIKYAEGELTLEEYLPMKNNRKKWREDIKFLEKSLT